MRWLCSGGGVSVVVFLVVSVLLRELPEIGSGLVFLVSSIKNWGWVYDTRSLVSSRCRTTATRIT